MILLRSLAFNLWLFVATTVLCLRFGLFRPDRAASLRAGHAWARAVVGGLRVLCGIDYGVTGTEYLPKSGAALIAPMHQSAFDTAVWVLLVPDFVYVLKKELTYLPLFGHMLGKAGMIAVNRRAGAAAVRELLRGADAAVAEQRQIVIFPEGTRVAPGTWVKLQPGVAALAARTGLPVIPVATDSGHHWGRRAFLKRPGTIQIAVLPPLPPGLPRAELMRRLAEAYAQGYAALRAPRPVDNSVGSLLRNFAVRPNRAL